MADPNWNDLSAEDALKRGIEHFDGSLVLASSLGVDSAVLLHMAAQVDPSLPIVFLETHKHFPETLTYRDDLITRLGLTNFRNIEPDPKEVSDLDPDGSLNETDQDLCCHIRKTRPLDRVMPAFKARITGRKRYQTPQRADMNVLELEDGDQARLNPLAFWLAKDVTRYMRDHDLPPHPLLAKGYLSIGCAPCTTPTKPGEDPRAGRWRNSAKTECGIHLVDGKWVRTPGERQTFEVF